MVDPLKKRETRESKFLERAIAESIASASSYQQEQSITCLDDICLKFGHRAFES
jgi:hypothetical protein